MQRKFPMFLFAAAAVASDPPLKRLFNSPFEVEQGEWFEDRELKTPYTPPVEAPVPQTPKDEAALLRMRVTQLETDKASLEARVAALEERLAKKAGKAKDAEGGE